MRTNCCPPDLGAAAAGIGKQEPALVWLCNPNNPTGTWLDRYSVQLAAEACQRVGALLVVDEAYWRFVFPHEAYSAVKLVAVTGGHQVPVLLPLTKHSPLPALPLPYPIPPHAP